MAGANPASGRLQSIVSGFSANTSGILAMVGASLCFITSDSLVKVLGGSLPVAQIIFLRGVLATVFILVVARSLGHLKPIPRSAWGKLTFRTLAEVCCTLLYLTALMHMPIPNNTAIMQSAPLFLTIYAALVLREDVGWRRWSAVLIGFAGMLLIVKPGTDGFNVYTMLTIGAALMVTGRDLLTRYLPYDIPALMITLVTMAALGIAGGAITLGTGDWRPVTPWLGLLIALTAIVLTMGFLCVITAMRMGEVSVVSPYRYTILLFALFYGYILFDEVPDLLALLGMALIAGSTLYVFARERRKRSAR